MTWITNPWKRYLLILLIVSAIDQYVMPQHRITTPLIKIYHHYMNCDGIIRACRIG
jgi:hypothetical protein